MRAIRKAIDSPPVVSLLIAVVVTLAILALRRTGHFETWELVAYDWTIRVHPERQAVEKSIVVIGITEQDIRSLGQWPLTDAVIADVLEKLNGYQPCVIGLDLYRDFSVPPGRESLETVLSQHANIVSVVKFGRANEDRIGPPPILEGSDRIGFNDLVVDRDGIVRRGLLFLDDGGEVSYSLALRLALMYLKQEGVLPVADPDEPKNLRLGPISLRPFEAYDGGYVNADARGYQILLDYRRLPVEIPSYPLSAVLSGQILPDAIKDKVVLIGLTALSVPDMFYTPFSAGFMGEGRGVYGVQIHANLVNQLLQGALDGVSPIAMLTETQEAAWILLWTVLGSTIGVFSRSTWRFVFMTASGLALLSVMVVGALVKGWWLPLVPPGMGWLGSAALMMAYMTNQENRQRTLLMQLFSRHVSPVLAEVIWRQRDQFLEGGRPRSQHLTVTVLFSDLEGFAPVCEKMDPQTLVDWLNTYIDTMAQVVIQHGGIVDDYYGDAIKANFGIPFARTTEQEIRQDAINAAMCALAMERELRRLNEVWQAQQLPVGRLRIGLYTGPAVAGSLGSADRLKYTTMGDTVNVAARLESWEKDTWVPEVDDSPCRILVGSSTVQYLDGSFQTKLIGDLQLKGKECRVRVYRLATVGASRRSDPE